jgi:elongation factor 1-alpha
MEQSVRSAKSYINLVVIGQQGSGKSTITGHLLYKVGAVDKRVVDRCEKEAAEKNKRNCKFLWVSRALRTRPRAATT